jgi:sugar lactone lactonase YvrE
MAAPVGLAVLLLSGWLVSRASGAAAAAGGSAATAAVADLLVAENNIAPWPAGHGEDPPPTGSLVRVDANGTRHLVATGLVDPVWVASSADGEQAYVGLFHSGEVVRVSLRDGIVTTVATGLSCPEGVALGQGDDQGSLYVVENPVGDECQSTFPLKQEAQLTRIDLHSATGAQTRIAGLRSSTGGTEGGPHGLAVAGGAAFVCECPAGVWAVVLFVCRCVVVRLPGGWCCG